MLAIPCAPFLQGVIQFFERLESLGLFGIQTEYKFMPIQYGFDGYISVYAVRVGRCAGSVDEINQHRAGCRGQGFPVLLFNALCPRRKDDLDLGRKFLHPLLELGHRSDVGVGNFQRLIGLYFDSRRCCLDELPRHSIDSDGVLAFEKLSEVGFGEQHNRRPYRVGMRSYEAPGRIWRQLAKMIVISAILAGFPACQVFADKVAAPIRSSAARAALDLIGAEHLSLLRPLRGHARSHSNCTSLGAVVILWERACPRRGQYRNTQMDNRTTRLSSTCGCCARRLFTTSSPIAINRVRVTLRDNPSNCAVCTWL